MSAQTLNIQGLERRPGRLAAWARVDALSAPTKRHEDWRFISLRQLLDAELHIAKLDASLKAADLEAFTFDDVIARVVFVNGVFSAALSSLEGAPKALKIQPLDAAALDDLSAAIAHKGFEQDYFAALTEAAATQGARISLSVKDTSVEGSVHLLHVTTDGAAGAAAPLRHQIEVSFGSKLNVIEDYVSIGESSHLHSPLVEVKLAPNARLNHVKLQRENTASSHIARTAIKVDQGAHYASVSVNMGAALSRHDLYADIHGADTTCELHGLTMIDDRQVSDTHSTMNHSHPHAVSDQLHKCVIGGRAHAVFNGKIFVREGAQQINAFQLNRNLLLSPTAKIDTKPQLEIFADDVKCSHGATIGQLDDEHLFYLQTRGINAEAARHMLTYAFAGEVITRVPMLSVRSWLERAVAHRTQS